MTGRLYRLNDDSRFIRAASIAMAGLKRLPRIADTAKFWLDMGTPRPFDGIALRGLSGLIGVEIGVFKGDHAAQLLKHCTMLYLVDPYVSYDGDPALSHGLQTAKEIAAERLIGKPVKFIYKSSTDCANETRNDFFDFVYLDGDHSYSAVVQDIESWWPKIISGGLLGGHDFSHAWPGVVQAVTEFSVNSKLKLNVQSPDWWIQKP